MLARLLAADGVEVRYGHQVVGLDRDGDGLMVRTTAGDLADATDHRLRRACSPIASPDSMPIRTWRSSRSVATTTPSRPDARALCRGLIYPVPDPALPFLGVHFTKRIDGEVWAGPNAVLATAREGYRRRDLVARDLVETIRFPGFRRLARRWWRTGASEVWRDVVKRAFVRDLQRYVPAIRSEHLVFGPSGVRAQAVRADGGLVDDFTLVTGPSSLHVVNAPSPAATASLAIAEHIVDEAERVLNLSPA